MTVRTTKTRIPTRLFTLCSVRNLHEKHNDKYGVEVNSIKSAYDLSKLKKQKHCGKHQAMVDFTSVLLLQARLLASTTTTATSTLVESYESAEQKTSFSDHSTSIHSEAKQCRRSSNQKETVGGHMAVQHRHACDRNTKKTHQ